MTTPITKAQRIRGWLALGEPPAEIAAIVGCRPEYVRAVRNRLRAGGATAADNRWMGSAANKERKRRYTRDWFRKRYWSDPVWRERHKADSRARSHARRSQAKARP